MTCSEYEVNISAYADGELNGKDLRELESHLAKCEACRTALEEISILQRDMTVVLMEIPKTPDLTESVMSRVKPRRMARARWIWAAAAVPALAAACAAFFVQANHGANPLQPVSTPTSQQQIVKDKPVPSPSTPSLDNPKPRAPRLKAHPVRTWHSPVLHTAIRHEPGNGVRKPAGLGAKSSAPPASQETAQVTVEYVDGIDALAIARSTDRSRYGHSNPSATEQPGKVNTATDIARPGDGNTGRISYRRIDGTWYHAPAGDGDM